jgi:hypothetical protein
MDTSTLSLHQEVVSGSFVTNLLANGNKPLKRLWKSTMGVQSPSTLPTEAIEIVRKEGLSFPVRALFYSDSFS